MATHSIIPARKSPWMEESGRLQSKETNSRRLLRVPWTARRSNRSILKEINSEYSLEGLMLKLKLQYFGHLMGRANSLEQPLILEKIEGRRRGRQRLRWLDGPLLFLPSIFPSIGVFSNELVLVSDGQSVEALASVLPMNIQS